MIASVIVYIAAIVFPFMRMESAGLSNQISVVDAILVLWRNDMMVIAILSALLILIVPITQVLLLLTINGAVHSDRAKLHDRARLAQLARLETDIAPWAMAEIFMIGVIVSLVKIGSLATISLRPAFWAMSALIVFLAMGTSANCRDSVWARLRPGA